MAIIRRKKVLDGIDREILRCLYQRNPKPMVSRNIAKCVGRTPSAISPRLNNLKTQGIIKPVKTIKNYTLDKTARTTKNPILWRI